MKKSGPQTRRVKPPTAPEARQAAHDTQQQHEVANTTRSTARQQPQQPSGEDTQKSSIPSVFIVGFVLCLAWLVYRVASLHPVPQIFDLPEVPVHIPKYDYYESPERSPSIVRNGALQAVQPEKATPVGLSKPCLFDSTADFFSEHKDIRTKRVVFDQVLDTEECELLIKLSDRMVKMGFSYHDDPLFHEKFAAVDVIDVYRAADSSEQQKIVEIRERIRSLIERHFKPSLSPAQNQILFELTHLTRRNPLPQDHPSHFDDSHGIHADNCMSFPNGSCIPMEESCCAWRSHSSILFLHGQHGQPGPHFTGGQLFFQDNTTKGERKRRVIPECGRLVAFTSGGENLHGVRNVLHGFRYVMAMWYSVDPVLAWEFLNFPELSPPDLQDLVKSTVAEANKLGAQLPTKPPPSDHQSKVQPAPASVSSDDAVTEFHVQPSTEDVEPLQFVGGFRTTTSEIDAIACPSCRCIQESVWGDAIWTNDMCTCKFGTVAHVVSFSKELASDGVSFVFETSVACMSPS
eukprot:TRINITY_DN4789_c0_g1_i1.p1 TRINITY_DN4789_c0_g1~~TRINITY_DN4789_c0_g1_i1.p1  ORF type:complete len:518 (+),score=-48.35 TRINITY_DN4789_c0_g1_i1:100-1653(+)